MKIVVSPIVFLVVVLGVYFPAFPVSDVILYRTTTIAVFVLLMAVAATDKILSATYLPILILFVCAICGLPLLAKGSVQVALEVFTSGVLGYLAYRYLRFPQGLIVCIYLICFYVIAYYWVNGTLDDVFVPRNGIKDGVSKNFVQISLLHLYLVYYVTCLRSNRAPSHLPFFLFPGLAIISAGAGSSVVSILLLIGYLLIVYCVNIVKGIVTFSVIALVGIVAQDAIFNSPLAERVNSGFLGIDRIILINRFIDALDSKSIIVGFDESVVFAPSLVESFGIATRNVHNSYLNLYRDIGIFSLPYIFLVFYTAYHMIRLDKILALLFFGTLLRALTDGYYFNWYIIDFILFYLFLLTPIGQRLVRPANSRRMEKPQKPLFQRI